jgi:flagellar export protein FliJ
MKEFKFNLDAVLEDRERREQEKARDLARARQEMDEARRGREALEARLADERDQVSAVQGGERAGVLRNRQVVIEQLREMVNRAALRETQAAGRVSQEREALRRAHQERQALERLRHRRKEEWQTQSARHEQAVLDESARERHLRNPTLRQLESEGQT